MPEQPIQLFQPHFRVDECLDEIRVCLESHWTGLGFKTLEIEKEWMRYTDLPHAHFLNSATAGLHLAVRLLKDANGWSDGDEIITTPLTFVSTNHAILYERLTPVFADVDEYLCLDPHALVAAITPRTRAVMFVGLGGNAGRLAEIASICRERGLRLIVDAAHMAGTRIDGRHVGHDADATVFSYQAVKNMPTADAGMICFRDASLDAIARRMTWLGISSATYERTREGRQGYRWYYDVEDVGFKYHGNSIMAAVALVSLRYLDEDNSRRRAIADIYDASFSGRDDIGLVPVAEGCESSRHLYQVLVEDRDETILHLNEHGIFPGVHYRDNTLYKMYAGSAGTCPRAEDASNRTISLPLHLGLSDDDVRRVATAVLGRPHT